MGTIFYLMGRHFSASWGNLMAKKRQEKYEISIDSSFQSND